MALAEGGKAELGSMNPQYWRYSNFGWMITLGVERKKLKLQMVVTGED